MVSLGHLCQMLRIPSSRQPTFHFWKPGHPTSYWGQGAVRNLTISFNGHCSHCSQEIRDIIPVPLRRVRTTRSSTRSHPFQVALPNPRALSHKSSFIPKTCNLWSVLPSSCFPESYNLPSFKSNVNELDLISLSS